MKPADNVEKFVNNAGIDTNPKMDQTVLDKVLTAHKKAEHAPNLRSIIMKSPITKVAAAVVLIAGICLTSLSGKSAWAQVVEAFNKATDVHIVKEDITANGLSIRAVEAWIKNQTLFRAEAQDWRVVDNGRNVLTLYKNDKIAHIRESFTPYWDYTPLILKVFHDSRSRAGINVTRLPQQCTATMDVYEIDCRDYWQGKAWVDPTTNLPLKISGRERGYDGRQKDFELSFDYEAIAEEIFSVLIPPDYRELPRLLGGEAPAERNAALSGMVVDQAGNPVPGAVVCASYAQYGYADNNGKFALLVSPEDGSGSMGPADFPLFVWAYPENDPYHVAWTLIRNPDAGEYSAIRLSAFSRPELRLTENEAGTSEIPDDADRKTERTHQGVRLVINDEDELSQYIPGSPGEVLEDSDENPIVRNIVLALGLRHAGVVTGRVTHGGSPIGQAAVELEMLEMRLGSNTLTITELDEEWKVRAWSTAGADNRGVYLLGNLPPCWSKARLVARAPGYAGSRLTIAKTGDVTTCDFQLVAGVSSGEPEDDDDYYRSVGRPRLSPEPDEDGSQHYRDVTAEGKRVRGGNVVTEVVPADLLANLMLYYSFDTLSGDGTAIDISGNGRNGQIHGARHVQDRSLGGGMEFLGDDVYIVVPEIAVEQFTFSGWVAAATEGFNNRLVYLLGDSSYYCTLQGNVEGGVGTTDSDDGEINEYDWEMKPGKSNHVTVTYDGQSICIYRNGKLTESGEGCPGPISGGLYIGGCPFDGQSSWMGYIDEVAFFDRALTPSEVARLFEMTGATVQDK